MSDKFAFKSAFELNIDDPSAFKVFSWSISAAHAEGGSGGGESASSKNSATSSFTGTYLQGNDGNDHVSVQKYAGSFAYGAQYSSEGIKEVYSETGSLALASKNFAYDIAGGYTLSGGSGTVDSLKFSHKSTETGANESYTGTKLSGAALATNDIAAFAAALFAGNDTITGTTGNDDIQAYAGDDKITGGKGADLMSGGTGNDTFLFKAGDFALNLGSHDVITDFGVGDDLLKLGKKVVAGKTYQELQSTFDSAASALAAANSAFASTKAKGNHVFAEVQGEGGNSGYLFQDANGDGAADALIELIGVTAAVFSAADIA